MFCACACSGCGGGMNELYAIRGMQTKIFVLYDLSVTFHVSGGQSVCVRMHASKQYFVPKTRRFAYLHPSGLPSKPFPVAAHRFHSPRPTASVPQTRMFPMAYKIRAQVVSRYPLNRFSPMNTVTFIFIRSMHSPTTMIPFRWCVLLGWGVGFCEAVCRMVHPILCHDIDTRITVHVKMIRALCFYRFFRLSICFDRDSCMGVFIQWNIVWDIILMHNLPICSMLPWKHRPVTFFGSNKTGFACLCRKK